MNNSKEISLKEVIQVLSLFFILSIISVVMIYAKFEQGVEDFWKSKDDYEQVLENSAFCDIIDLDSIETQGDVCEIDQKELENRYNEANGKFNVFNKLFEAYVNNGPTW